MKPLFRKEFRIGLLVVVALLILFFGINFLKGVNVFKAANYYYAQYTNVEGLAISAPVTVNGFKVGIVRDIQYQYNNPGHVVVELSLDKALRIPKGSKAMIASDILGTATVTLSMAHESQNFYNVGDTVPGVVEPGMMAGISENLMPAVNSILPKVDTLLSSLNAVVTNPALTTSLNRLDNISSELEQTMRSLHQVMAQMGPVTKDIKSITSNVDTITSDLAVSTGRLREAPIDSMMTDLAATMANLKQLTDQLNNPNSSIGKLTNDPALYDNLNSTISSLDSLFVDIKRNPKRYISIKLL